MHNSTGLILLLLGGVAILAALLHQSFLFSFPLKPDVFQFDQLMTLLAPAFLASAFVERAIEVVIQTWRNFDRVALEAARNRIQEQLSAERQQSANKKAETVWEQSPLLSDDLERADERLARFRSDTMKTAVCGVWINFERPAEKT